MNITFKFKDGSTVVQEMGELQTSRLDDGFLRELRDAKINNESLNVETSQGLVVKKLSELSSIEIFFE